MANIIWKSKKERNIQNKYTQFVSAMMFADEPVW